MILKLFVLVAAIAQVAAAAFLNIGAFENTDRALPVFIQPAGWAFSIWGLIYTLSLIYAVYQIVPKNDSKILRATRLPALVGFVSSIGWLYFAGQTDWTIWLTIPILFLMAGVFTFVVNTPDSGDKTQTLLSKKFLLPYAAWTGIASWLNIQALLNDQLVVTSETVNYITNGILFVCIAAFTLYYFKRSGYSAWYGGVLVWAGVGVISANLDGGSMVFVGLAGALIVAVVALCFKAEKTKR
jgi:hypothetical protein